MKYEDCRNINDTCSTQNNLQYPRKENERTKKSEEEMKLTRPKNYWYWQEDFQESRRDEKTCCHLPLKENPLIILIQKLIKCKMMMIIIKITIIIKSFKKVKSNILFDGSFQNFPSCIAELIIFVRGGQQ